ncbi:MAG: hypothetical protein ACO3ZD_09510 [Cyanobium sp.]
MDEMAEMANQKTAIDHRGIDGLGLLQRLTSNGNEVHLLLQLQSVERRNGMEVGESLFDDNLPSGIPDQALRPSTVQKKPDLRQGQNILKCSEQG